MGSFVLHEERHLYQRHQICEEESNQSTIQYSRRNIIPQRQKLEHLEWKGLKDLLYFMLQIVIASLPSIIYIYCYTNYHHLKQISGNILPLKPDLTLLPTLDKIIFGILPHQWTSSIAHPLLDITAAIPYILHFFLPVIAVTYIYLTAGNNKTTIIFQLLWCGGWVNLIAFIIQFLYPTAPPWFVESNNSDNASVLLTAANEAALSRVDNLLGITTFHRIYSTATITFGALPSLHVAWPVVILLIYPIVNIYFTIFYIIWISWAALYSLHHYAIDIIAAMIIVHVVHFLLIRIWCPFKNKNSF